MAEAIISRASPNIPEDILDPIPTTSTTHGIKVTLKDPDGVVMSNWPVVCKDGNQTYSYTTNEKGQTIFSVSSGAANIFVNNYVSGVQYLDIQSKWMNIDAPVGLSTRANISLDIGNNFYEFLSSKLFGLYKNRDCELILVGGGGGGSFGTTVNWGWSDDEVFGGGGASGNLNQYNNQFLFGAYNFQVGSGGKGYNTSTGNTGGTSYIVNTDYSAAGGVGGSKNNIAVGGLGNGARGGNDLLFSYQDGFLLNMYNSNRNSWINNYGYKNPTSSPVNFAGGGGSAYLAGYFSGGSNWALALPRGNNFGGYVWYGSSNVNRKKMSWSDIKTVAASRGGGGYGGIERGDKLSQNFYAGNGGTGLMRINIFY